MRDTWRRISRALYDDSSSMRSDNFKIFMQMSEQRIEIPLDKSKIVLMLIGALAFVGIGLWFVISPPQIKNSFWGDPLKLAIVGYASILAFSFFAFYLIRKLPDNRPGLVIDDTGLVDNSSGLSAGHVAWADIEGFSVIEIHKQKLIMVHVKNPADYIGRQTSLFRRKSMQANANMYGTPISITTNGLKISFDELLKILVEKLKEKKIIS